MQSARRQSADRPPGSFGRRCAAIAATLLFCGSIAPLFAQGPPANGSSPVIEPSDLSLPNLESRLSEISTLAGIDDQTRQQLTTLYQDAIAASKSAAEWESKLVEYQRSRLGSPERQEQLRSQLTAGVQEPQMSFPADAGVAEFEQAVAQRAAELDAAQAAAKKLEDDASTRAVRRKEIPARIIEIRQALDELVLNLDKPFPVEGDRRLHIAGRIRDLMRRRALESEWSALEEELANYDARDVEAKLRADVASLDITNREKVLAAWREQLNQVRTREAEKAAAAAREAQREAARKHPVVKSVADVNAQLAEDRANVATKLVNTEKYVAELGETAATLSSDYARIQNIINSVGLTPNLANRVRMELENLPSVRLLKRGIRERRDETSVASVNADRYDTQHEALQRNFEEQVAAALAKLEPEVGEFERSDIEATVRDLLKKRQELLVGLTDDYTEYVNLLTKALPEAETKLLQATEEYEAYLSERVLWIRSCNAVSGKTISNAYDELIALVKNSGWAEVGQIVLVDLKSNPLNLAALAGFVILLLIRPLLIKGVRETGIEASKPTLRSYAPTLRGFLITILLAVTFPILVWYLSWRLLVQAGNSDFVKAFGIALQTAALSLFFLSLLFEICRRDGLGEAHFNWSPRALRLVRRSLIWLALFAIPAVVVVAILDSQPITEAGTDNSLSRLASMIWALAILIFVQRVCSPRRGAFAEAIANNPTGWLARFRWLWYSAALALPILLTIANLSGYYYTSLQFAWRLRITSILIVSLVVLHALMESWILAAKRKLAIDRFRKWRAAQAEKREKEAQTGTESTQPAVVDEPIDLPTIGVQTRRLLNAATTAVLIIALWGIWIDVLPALNRLREVHLWSVTMQVAGTATDGTGTTIEAVRFVTLADLVLAIVILLVTVIAGRNLPGLLEITLLGWMPLDTGARYAATTVCRYIITVVGLVLSFWAIGITWTSVQWLAAAITVGLGFGLQEIFANFVAGLILLFERPIRLGDTVTVAGTSGKVTRIRIRATTITDWDRKELIIPNKEFITGSVINWSLTDRLIRAVLRVGVAYGTDTELVCKLLTQVARDNRRVVDDPPPRAFLVGFGESSIDFELQVHVGNVDDLVVRHELNMAIEAVFRESGIQIPFPQREMLVKLVGLEKDIIPPKLRPETAKRP